MGFETTLSMNLGMLVGWAVLAPLAKHQGWAPGKVSDAEGGRGWILWIALAIMVRPLTLLAAECEPTDFCLSSDCRVSCLPRPHLPFVFARDPVSPAAALDVQAVCLGRRSRARLCADGRRARG